MKNLIKNIGIAVGLGLAGIGCTNVEYQGKIDGQNVEQYTGGFFNARTIEVKDSMGNFVERFTDQRQSEVIGDDNWDRYTFGSKVYAKGFVEANGINYNHEDGEAGDSALVIGRRVLNDATLRYQLLRHEIKQKLIEQAMEDASK